MVVVEQSGLITFIGDDLVKFAILHESCDGISAMTRLIIVHSVRISIHHDQFDWCLFNGVF